jgi:ornithine carbamoyltransferase
VAKRPVFSQNHELAHPLQSMRQAATLADPIQSFQGRLQMTSTYQIRNNVFAAICSIFVSAACLGGAITAVTPANAAPAAATALHLA